MRKVLSSEEEPQEGRRSEQVQPSTEGQCQWWFDSRQRQAIFPYLSSSLCTYEPSRSLRSSNEKLLKIPKRDLKSFGQRSFSFMAPSLWNSLPATLRNVPTRTAVSIQIAAKNFVCTGLPVESEEICVCVAVECRWMHMDRERAKGRGGGGKSMRDLGKRRHGLGGWLRQIQIGVVVRDHFVNYCTSGQAETGVRGVSLCVCVCVCVIVW